MMTAHTLSKVTLASASDRLCQPIESTSYRRLSDSIVSGSPDQLAKESETGLDQLRKWASGVIKARPSGLHLTADKENLSHTDTAWRQRQLKMERSTSPESPSLKHPSFLINGLQERPASMLAGTLPLEQASLSTASTSSLARSASVHRKPEQKRISSSPESRSNKTLPATKSQSKEGLLPALGPSDQERDYESTSIKNGKASKSHGLHLSLAPYHSILLPPDERTPRGKSMLSPASTSSSTPESDDDKFDLMTPSEGQSPYHRRRRINQGVSRDSDSIGSSGDHTMQSMTEFDLAGRRGSLPRNGIKSRVAFAFSSRIEEIDGVHIKDSSVLVGANAINRSTLFEVGSVEGLTPPALRNHTIYSAESPSSQAVSAGLEMGLGVTSAISSLSSNLPATSSSSINIMAGSRFSHNAIPLSYHNAPTSASSDHFSQDMSFARLDHEEGELARRRTTGGLIAADRKDVGIVGSRRHNRAGTHDLRALGYAFSGSPHVPTSAPLREGSYPRKDELPLRLDTSESIRHKHTSSSDSFPASSVGASTAFDSTPTGTPFGSHKGVVSPDASVDYNRHSFISTDNNRSQNRGGLDMTRRVRDAHDRDLAAAGEALGNITGQLLGMGGGGHFGPGVRTKISTVLTNLIEQVPLLGHGSETIQLVEYGSLNSRSAQLMQPIITAFVDKQARQCPQLSSPHEESTESPLTFQITHETSSSADFRPLMQLLDHSSESYLDPHWQKSHSPSLSNTIFSSFAARPFASRIAPPSTIHAGISLMDLHWLHTPSATISPALTAQAELTTFLSARGSEFKKGGLFIMAYIARSEEATTPYSQYKDIWTTLSNTLAPCIQRLVSCSMVKSDVARHLLNLPMHPRTTKQTKLALDSVSSTWQIEWSCGLDNEEKGSSGLTSEALPLRLPHPAWKAYSSGTLSRIPFTEHMVQLFKNLYETHFRNVLREKGKLSKGAVEFVLDSLWDVLFSRIVDQDPSPMKDIEVQVSIIALRRR